MMLVRNAPVAIDFAQSHSESEEKTVLVHGVAGRIGSTPHDGYCEGDLCGRSNGEFSEVEGCAGFVVAKKQVPRLGVRFNASALKRRRQIEHHHFLIMMREDRGKIVTADSVCPALKQGFDHGFFGVGRHSLVSLLRPLGRLKVSLFRHVCELFPMPTGSGLAARRLGASSATARYSAHDGCC